MLRTPIDLRPLLPFTRVLAAKLATIGGHFDCSLTLEQEGLSVNLKSMLGMLSQTMKPAPGIVLVANGADEKAASAAILKAIKDYQADETASMP